MYFSLHNKLEVLYNENEDWFDEIAERLLASGHKPASTTKEFEEYTMLSEDPADKYLKAEEMIERAVEDYRSTRELCHSINLR